MDPSLCFSFSFHFRSRPSPLHSSSWISPDRLAIHRSKKLTPRQSFRQVCASQDGGVSAPTKKQSPAANLRALLARPGIITMPCCFDALSAKLVQRAGFDLTFMSGFSASAARLAAPDTQLMSYGEMVDHGRDICSAVHIPVIGDGDTGYGNAINIKRTVKGYSQAGFAAIMIEDQVAPKRCGHTRGKQVIGREEAFTRIQAAVDAARENDILVLARTDARATLGINEAIYRAQRFKELGADIIFVEAPQTVEEMKLVTSEVPGYHLANMLENGKTPILPPAELESMGFKIAAYPLTLLSAAIKAMQKALELLKEGKDPQDLLLHFEEVQDVVGFVDYWREEDHYAQVSKDFTDGDQSKNGSRSSSWSSSSSLSSGVLLLENLLDPALFIT